MQCGAVSFRKGRTTSLKLIFTIIAYINVLVFLTSIRKFTDRHSLQYICDPHARTKTQTTIAGGASTIPTTRVDNVLHIQTRVAKIPAQIGIA
jgi:hypothetical protein